MVQVKICGLTDPTHIRVAAEAGADWAGFVLYPDSPRNVLAGGAEPLQPLMDLVQAAQAFGLASTVLVVNPEPDLLHEVFETVRPDAVQFHGQETIHQLQDLQRSYAGNTEIWKAFGVSGPADLDDVDAWPADRFLLDAKPEQTAGRPGGNGVTLDWDGLGKPELDRPWFLAGGLNAENVAEAIAITNAYAVDVSSGVETAPGLKDEDLIRAFIDRAKSI